jgi:hypothetical protein
MTSHEVLTVLIDMWRQRHCIDPGEPIVIPLSRDTNIEVAANLLGVPRLADSWSSIATYFNNWFRVKIDGETWRAVLQPKQSCTLGPVCDLIATHALAPAIEREVDGVRMDWADAAFRSVLLVLNESGVSIKGIEPETRLIPYLRARPDAFINHVSRLSPGRMPALRTTNHALHLLVALAAAVIVWWLLQWLFPGYPWPRLWGLQPIVVFSLIAIAIAMLSYKRLVVRRLGELSTFDDLCYALVSPPPDVPPPLPPVDGEVVRWDIRRYPIVTDWWQPGC